MQRPLLVLACATSVAVGVLCAATVTAYASPVTGEHVVSAPSLVVPPNYRPANFAAPEVAVAASGVTRVAPVPAVELHGNGETQHTGGSKPRKGDDSGGTVAAPVPITTPTPTPTPTPSPTDNSANNGGNDLGNKDDGSNKSTDKNNDKSKDKGKNKDKGKS